MPFDVSAGSFAAAAITAIFWWTVLSPLGLLAAAVLCARRLRLRLWLTLAILVPPILVFLPVTVMHAGRHARLRGAGGRAHLRLTGLLTTS